MMKLVIVLSFALVGNVFASDDGECSAADGQQVLNDWTHLWENSDSSFKVEFAKDILIKLLQVHPEARELFHGVGVDNPNSGAFEAHALRIFNSFDLLVSLLPHRDALHEASEHLGQQHASRAGVLGHYFQSFGKLLLDDLDHLLDDFHFIAWKSCFKTLTKELVNAVPQ